MLVVAFMLMISSAWGQEKAKTEEKKAEAPNPNSQYTYNVNFYSGGEQKPAAQNPAPAAKPAESKPKETVKLIYVNKLPHSEYFQYGITAGANITRVDSDGSGFMHTGWKFDSSGGYFVGLAFRLPFPKSYLSVDFSFVYSQEMADISSNEARIYDKLRSFQTPVHLRWDFELPFLEEVLVPYAYAGVQYTFSLNDFDWYKLFNKDSQKNGMIDKEQYEDGIMDKLSPGQNMTERRVWKFDLGLGVLICNHVQIFWNYSMPLNNTFRFKTVYEDARNNFKIGNHRIGTTYYF